MLTAILVIVGAAAAWILVDRLILQRDQRAAWTRGGRDRVFHSTGWEETVPPLEAIDVRLEELRRRSRRSATA